MIRHLIFVALTVCSIPWPAPADTAMVRGGEHADFTRIVIEASSLGDWQLGRSAEGYEFRATGPITDFDLNRAFDKIPRSRVSALRHDPETGALHLSIPCSCHATAVEVRPGLLAIDLRNGAPPPDSLFENPVIDSVTTTPDSKPSAPDGHEGHPPPPPFSPSMPGPVITGYDWLAIVGLRSPPAPSIADEEISDEIYAQLEPMRDALLRQISRGIAEGVIDPGVLDKLPNLVEDGLSEVPGLRVSSGELPGIRATTRASPGPNLTAEGKPCLPDRLTDISTWREGKSVSGVRANLVAEFDTPQTANIIDAARYHIAIGFGAEARQLLALLPRDDQERQRVLLTLSFLTDLEPSPADAFSGMESCDTAAALWAVLSIATEGGKGPLVSPNTAAISRSFSVLPLEMRRHLGPTLVDFFLSRQDEITARRLHDAILRAPGPADPQVQLMKAGIALATGNSSGAAEIAEGVMTDPGGSAAEAAILIAEAALAGSRIVPSDLASQLSALSVDRRDSADYPRIRRAEILALAMSGAFRSAFDLLPEVPAAVADTWNIAARDAPDDLLLVEALSLSQVPATDRLTAVTVAKRLFEHGFAQEALLWLGPATEIIAERERLLATEAALATRNARLALTLLSGLEGDEADALRARIAIQLGNSGSAAELLRATGQQNAALRAEFWSGDWDYIARSDAQGLSAAAAFLTPGGSPDNEAAEGILTRGGRLTAESEAVRDAVGDLLQAVPQQFQ